MVGLNPFSCALAQEAIGDLSLVDRALNVVPAVGKAVAKVSEVYKP